MPDLKDKRGKKSGKKSDNRQEIGFDIIIMNRELNNYLNFYTENLKICDMKRDQYFKYWLFGSKYHVLFSCRNRPILF